ncbi:TonB-dependent siderophore receptor [Pleurocapsales cyanobacterium LEGE 06147]|nr:TonB-dependent siderophore receptor [Pleurocapsales cyanobacterium LEGE 06147]
MKSIQSSFYIFKLSSIILLAAINPVAAEAIKNHSDLGATTQIKESRDRVSTSARDLLSQEKKQGDWEIVRAEETFLDTETRRRRDAGRREREMYFPNSPVSQFPNQASVVDLKQNDLSGTAADLVAQGVTRVTGVQINQTESGLELVLETVAGSERLVPLILPEGNELVIDLLDATLAFSIRNGVTKLNPAPGINRITVNQADENSIRVRITGENQAPSAEVVPGGDDLVLSITPESTIAEQEPDEEIEVIATGEAEDDDYYVPDASTATRTETPLWDIPASVQVVPQEVIEDQGATNVREVVRNVAGVTFADSIGNRAERFNLRGFQAEQFLNGIREDTVFSNRTQQDLANIERVEVLKGPASVLFGRAEPSGIINFITKQPLLEPYYNLEFTAGNFDFYRPSLDISGPLTDNKKLAYRLNVAYENAGSFRDFIDTERIFVAPVLAWQISPDTEFTAEFSYLNDNRPIDRGLVVLSDDEVADVPLSRTFTNGEDIEYEQTKVSLYFDHRFNSTLSLRSAFRYTDLNEISTDETDVEPIELLDDRFLTLQQFGTDGDTENSETYTFQTDLTAEFNTGSIQHKVLLGLEYAEVDNTFFSEVRDAGVVDIFDFDVDDIVIGDEVEFVFDGASDISSFGIYLQDQVTLLENLKLVVGGRFDTYTEESSFLGEVTEAEADAFSPRVGIVYQPIQPVSLYASYTRSFTPVGGTDVEGEPFDPQRGTGLEQGLKLG